MEAWVLLIRMLRQKILVDVVPVLHGWCRVFSARLDLMLGTMKTNISWISSNQLEQNQMPKKLSNRYEK